MKAFFALKKQTTPYHKDNKQQKNCYNPKMFRHLRHFLQLKQD